MKAMVEGLLPYNEVHISTAVFDEKSQTYDVTQSVEGMFYEMFLVMQKYLNFTSSLHKRKDGKWGFPRGVFKNDVGTYIKFLKKSKLCLLKTIFYKADLKEF